MAGRPKKERRRAKTPVERKARSEPAPPADTLVDSARRWRELLEARKAEIAATPGLSKVMMTAEEFVLQPRIELARIAARQEIRKPARATEKALLAMAAVHVLENISIADLNQAYQQNPRAFELACRTTFEQLVYRILRR